MNRIKRILIMALAVGAVLQTPLVSAQAPQPASATVQTKSPSVVAGEATEKVIALLMTGREKFSKDPELFAAEVEKIIEPVISFDAIARGVMGRFAHRASEAEIKEFTVVFRESLMLFYSKAVLAFNTGQLALDKVEPVPAALMEQYQAKKSRSVPVNITVRSNRQNYLMSYSMEQNNGHWMVRNIIVEGINLGLQLRNQYAEAMNRYRKISTVTAQWPKLIQGADSSAKRG